MAPLPEQRGDLSALVLGRLGPEVRPVPPHLPPVPSDPIADEDLQLALYVCYELHYRGFLGVDDEWEWNTDLLALRAQLERQFLSRIRSSVEEGFDAEADMDEMSVEPSRIAAGRGAVAFDGTGGAQPRPAANVMSSSRRQALRYGKALTTPS